MSTPIMQPELGRDEILALLRRQTKRLTIIVGVVAILFFAGISSDFFFVRYKLRTIVKEQKDLEFSQFVSSLSRSDSTVQPTVNTIQFLHKGYSISFDKVDYNQNGLELSGQIGNPTNLWINSLALSFTARPSPYSIKDKWEKADIDPTFIPWWQDDWNIGSAQTTVGLLNPGSTASFTVTIPNVKQTSEMPEIVVSFSGERYSYLGK